jgi:hypothetical protein
MKTAFTKELRTGTSTPMLLADQRKTEKDRRKKANAEQPAKPDGGLQEAAKGSSQRCFHEAHSQRRLRANHQASQRARDKDGASDWTAIAGFK